MFSIYIIGLQHIETAANDTLPISTAHLDKSGVKHSDITIRLARFGAKIKPYFQNDNDTTIRGHFMRGANDDLDTNK